MRKSNVTRIWLALAAAAATDRGVRFPSTHRYWISHRGAVSTAAALPRAASTPLRYCRVVLAALRLRGLADWISSPPPQLVRSREQTWKALSWGCLSPRLKLRTAPTAAAARRRGQRFLGGIDPAADRAQFARSAGSVGPDRRRQLDSDHQGHPPQSRDRRPVQWLSTVDICLVPVSGQSPVPIDGPAGSVTVVVIH